MTHTEQTKQIERLREMLQSIAITAVRAQERIGNFDSVLDAIADIESDCAKAARIADKLINC